MTVKLIPKYKPAPLNQSPEHFILTQIAVVMLKENFKCKWAGNEVYLPPGKRATGGPHHKYIADAVGIKRNIKDYTIRCIEAKVSLSDFRAGFCRTADYAHIIAPKGLLTPDMLPAGMGLVEVDFNELRRGRKYLHGVEVVRKAVKARAEALPADRQAWVDRVMREICAGYTNERVYRNEWFYEDERY